MKNNSIKNIKHYAIVWTVAGLIAITTGHASTSTTPTTTDTTSTSILTEVQKLNNVTMPALPDAWAESIDNLFGTADPLFPTISATTIDQLNTLINVREDGKSSTEDYLHNQLKTLPNNLSVAYINLSVSRSEQLTDPLKNAVKALTYDNPSFDTLYLPLYSCTKSRDPTTCAKKPNDEIAKNNANNLNFDALFTPTDYSVDDQSHATQYIRYALQTYNPTFESTTTNSSGSDNKGFFATLNDKLQALNSSNNRSGETANGFLITHILQNADFQKFWLALRSYESKRSLIISNFNYLKAERTPQKGLGTAYGLAETPDASAMQVDSGLMDKTINNPDWYKQMKTANPVTLQREQLLLTSMLLRIQYQNKLINERNLATLSILTNTLLEQTKQGLSAQEGQLKNALFPDDSSSETK